ncbi:hypothetical protein SOM19_02560, partial [Microbacterium sp. CFBP9034]|nr:hypothetical protein [Microbacterium sp. CFBP9034]
MSTTTITRRRVLRPVAMGSSILFVASGLVAIATATPAAAADAEAFLVSRVDAGASTQPYLTADAQHVAFVSTATGLAPGDTNGVADVFLSTAIPGSGDPFSGPATRVSVPDPTTGESQANGPSGEPVVSADGRYVVFSSTATNLVPGSFTPGRRHVYLRDTVVGTTIVVDAVAGGEADGDSHGPDMSDDGGSIVFESAATNLSGVGADGNGAPDAFFADLDADDDGARGDLALTRFLPTQTVAGGTGDPQISGNGEYTVFTSRVDSLSSVTSSSLAGAKSLVYRGRGAHPDSTNFFEKIATDAVQPTIDALGSAIAYVDNDSCGQLPTIVATSIEPERTEFSVEHSVAVGTAGIDRSVGYVEAPVISADGTTVVWQTTQPSTGAPALAEPVVRRQRVQWADTSAAIQCNGPLALDHDDLAAGTGPTLSASGRTVAYSGASSAAPGATSSALAIDTHSNAGISAGTVQGTLAVPGFMTSLAIADIPISELRDYAAVLADAPIYRLPIYRLPIYRLPIYRLPIYRLMVEDSPIYRLPIYRLPIYRLPIYRLDIPGGWTELLSETPFAGELELSVTLAEVLDWAATAAAAAPDGSPETEARRAAAQRILTLSLDDVDLTDSGISGLTITSLILGGAPLGSIPIAGDGDDPMEEAGDDFVPRWQSRVQAQGLPFTVETTTVLADVDAIGLDIGRTGIEDVPLGSLPIDATLFSEIRMNDLFLTSTPLGAVRLDSLSGATRAALVGAGSAAVTLADAEGAFLTDAALDVLAAETPDDITVGDLLFSMLDAESYPWEQIAPSAIDPTLALEQSPGRECDGLRPCSPTASFRFTFDPGPGETTTFRAPTATVQLPAGTTSEEVEAAASGPRTSAALSDYTGPVQRDDGLTRFPLPDSVGGTVIEFRVAYSATSQPSESSATAVLTVGDRTTEPAALYSYPSVRDFDDARHNRIGGAWADPNRTPTILREGNIYYEWIAPQFIENDDDTGERYYGPAEDEDWYLVDAPAPGKRLVISTNAADGQISVGLYRSSDPVAELGTASAGAAPGTGVTEQSGVGSDAERGADAGTAVEGRTLVDQAVVGGTGSAEVEAASTDAAAGEQLLVRVTSGNGEASSSLYSLRVRLVDEAVETTCTPWTLPVGANGAVGASQSVTGDTNTIYLFDQKRFGDTYGASAAQEVRAALEGLDSPAGATDSAFVRGAVLSIDSDSGVATARAALDANPCSMSARGAWVSAVNTFVAQEIGTERAHISSIVLVGADDIVPFAPVAQNTAQFNEASHAAELRLSVPRAGGACLPQVEPGTLDPCATPLSAAAASNVILSDDPYALARAYDSAGGRLYVPSVAVGRLVDTPQQILQAIDRFRASDGVLQADSTLTGGYGAWSELPDLVTSKLDWRSPADTVLQQPWSATTLLSQLLPAAEGAPSPRVVSVNTHADETRMLPGIIGAESGRFADADLFTAGGLDTLLDKPDGALVDELGAPVAVREKLAGALFFLIGCHAGNNLPTGYYGDTEDWADVFSAAGGFVGNTGYGLANGTSTALSERLLELYSDWVGVRTAADGPTVSAAAALTFAKQSYLGRLGLYTGYDEKVLMQAVYYGLPMYTFADTPGDPKLLPLPAIPADLSPVEDGAGLTAGLRAASLSLHPAFETTTVPGPDGDPVTYLTADDQEPLTAAGQPVLPKVVSRLETAPGGTVARGALITALSSELDLDDLVTPAIAEPDAGVAPTSVTRNGVAFPSTYATVTRQDSPAGPLDLLVVTPGRVSAALDGRGVMEKFTDLDLSVVYGAATSTDRTAPVVRSRELPSAGERWFGFELDGTGSTVETAFLLVTPEGSTGGPRAWEPLPLIDRGGGLWEAKLTIDGPVRWMLQAVDAGGNVMIETSRGRLDAAGAPMPAISALAGNQVLALGDRLVESVTIDAAGTDPSAYTATYNLTRADGTVAASGVAAITTTPDGTATRATIDRVMAETGSFAVSIRVCHGGSCTTSGALTLTVDPPNDAPAATVDISSSDGGIVTPASVLTAVAASTDPDSDDVSMTYAWSRNGQAFGEGMDVVDLSKAGAAPGDVIRVVATPNDGATDGHAAFAEVVVAAEVPLPTIELDAVSDGVPYTEGTWATDEVLVSFACTGTGVVCPDPVTVTTDTPGTLISRTVTDTLGREATTAITVTLDRTPPALAPVVTPDPVAVGGTATARAGATDTGSGIAEQSCDTPVTTTAGSQTLSCQATDTAGNTSTATATYTVVAPSAACRSGSRVVLQPVNPG